MAKFPFTEEQKRIVLGLAPCLKNKAIGATWVIMHGDDTVSIFDMGADNKLQNSDCNELLNSIDTPDLDVLEQYGLLRALEIHRRYTVNVGFWLETVDNELAEPAWADRRSQQITITGDVIGSNIGIQSSFQNIQQHIGHAEAIPENIRVELDQLFQSLGDQLQQLPSQHEDDAEVITYHATEAAKQLSASAPKKAIIRTNIEALAKAAENVRKVALPVVLTATEIARVLGPYLK